jgi:outer membrane protein, heavy metal efflux system
MINKTNSPAVRRAGLILIIMLSITPFTFSQVDSSFIHRTLTYRQYLEKVISNNLEYTSEKFNMSIAEAKIESARVFENPSVEIDYAKNSEEGIYKGNSITGEVSKTFELGQKRRARINAAKSESTLTRNLLDDYLRNLLADATLDYLNALKQKYLYDVMLNSYEMMKELSEADSIRFSLGSIKAIDASQSRIEAGILLNSLLQIDADRKKAYLNLSTRASLPHSDTIILPAGKFEKSERPFILNELLSVALNKRADLLAAKNNITLQQDLLTLTKSERKADIEIKAGTSHTYLNHGMSTPAETQIYTGATIPLKFSNLNKGEIKIARFQIDQVELIYKQSEIKIQNEVAQAYIQYKSLYKQVENYNHGLLEKAKGVLDGKVYSYSRGETSLLEVLNAQRTYNDLQTSYYETLYNCNEALIELERSVGFCDIDL